MSWSMDRCMFWCLIAIGCARRDRWNWYWDYWKVSIVSMSGRRTAWLAERCCTAYKDLQELKSMSFEDYWSALALIGYRQYVMEICPYLTSLPASAQVQHRSPWHYKLNATYKFSRQRSAWSLVTMFLFPIENPYNFQLRDSLALVHRNLHTHTHCCARVS